MFPEEIETDRLRLERLTHDDCFALYEHAKRGAPAIEEITEYVTWSPHRSLGETRGVIEGTIEEYEAGEGVTYAIRPIEGEPLAGEFAGLTGLAVDWEKRTATLGLWLREPLWGRGYSGERAGALMDLAFSRLDLDLVAVAHYPDNGKSKRAIEKYVERYGGRQEGLFRNNIVYADGTVVDEVRYTVSQTEYREAVAESS
jgi:RimJ/RimL family protein N-acetyltransferase